MIGLALWGALAVAMWPSSDLLGHHDDPVGAVAVGELEGRPVAVSAGSGYDDTTLRMWDLTTGDPMGEPIVAHPVGIVTMALGEVDGRLVAVTGGYDDAVRIWDLTTRELIGEPIRLSNTERVDAVAVGEVDGRAVFVAAGDWGNAGRRLPVHVWDLATHEAFGEPLVGHTGLVFTVALGEVNGRAVAVTGSVDGTTRMWDLATRQPIGDPMISGGGAGDVVLGQVDGRPAAVFVGRDENLRVWDLSTRQLVGEPIPTGHAYGARTVELGEVNGRPVALSGGGGDEDSGGAVQVWDLRTRKPLGERMRYANWVGDVVVEQVDGKVVAVTGDGDGDVRMRDLSAYTR
ncbi:WD40 repeat domain-containing protein [Streptosporangium fragile]|uniref:WD40 repeat domain-containing protein n=1 Tax=Streptosporangium fragile TaxID=46186 RepID=UPI0031EE336E